MIGIIIGDLMSSTNGQLNKESKFTSATTNAVAVMEWLTNSDYPDLKKGIERWSKKYNTSKEVNYTMFTPIASYSQNFIQAIQYTNQAPELNIDKALALALIDALTTAKLKGDPKELHPNFLKIYGQNEITKVLKEFAESKGFWEAVTRALKLEGVEATNASLAGALAGIYYGLSKSIRDKALAQLPNEMKTVILEFEKQSAKRNTKEALAQLRFIQM